MTGYIRKDTTNNIADGNIVNAADLDNEFDGVVAAFNASTGHTHGGGVGEGAPIIIVGPTQDVTISALLVSPKTSNIIDIGSSTLKFKDLYIAGAASVSTLASTVATGTAPFIVASTTKVTNLNADLLDGADWASPASLGSTTPSSGAFTTLAASGVITSTVATGTAPVVVASTTKVTNLNADLLDGADWASPAALGSTTPAAVTGTTISGTDTTNATSISTGALKTAGGLGVTKALWVGGLLNVAADSSFISTGALLISKGTTAQQPGTPVTGMVRYNITSNEFEGYSGSSPAWKSIGGSALSNDTSTSSNLYPVFAAATTGTAQNLYTSNANYLYKPSTGELQASALVSTNGITINSGTVAASYTIATGTNGFSVGPITVNSGVAITVASGQQWVVI
jgi:hypothetical protein